MVLQAPLLRLLHRRYGAPCKLLTFGAWSRPLYSNSEDIQAIWQLRLRHAPYPLSPERWSLVRELRRHEGPVYVSEDIPIHVDRIRRLLNRAGIPASRCVFLDDCSSSAEHWVDKLLEFGCVTPKALSEADFPWRDADLRRAPELDVHPDDREDCNAWLERKLLAGTRIVLLQPGNKRTNRRIASRKGHDSKAWPSERWAALIHAIRATDQSFRVVLCGSVQERSLLEEIRSMSAFADTTVVATKDLPIRRLMALAQQAHSMVGVDTGPLHIAGAVGCPLVVLYGAESPARWDRRSPNGSAVVNLGGPPRTSVADVALDEVVGAWRGISATAV